MDRASVPRPGLTLVATCVAQGMILLDVTIVNVALPAIQAALGVTPANLEWVISAYTLALAALILVGGALGDRYGRKRVFLIGLVTFTACSALCAIARDDPELIAYRALQGVGGALMAALTLSILVDAVPPERRTSAIGTWAAVAGLGFAMGPILGGILIAAFGWSAVWPSYVLAGLGYGLLVPAVASAAMGEVPPASAGVGSGVLNSARQLGTTVGLAAVGSLGVAATSRAWDRALDMLPAAVRAEAPSLVQRVAGAEGDAVAAILGPEATRPAFAAFLAGYRSALWAAGLALLVAAAVACVGLRRPATAPRLTAPTSEAS